MAEKYGENYEKYKPKTLEQINQEIAEIDNQLSVLSNSRENPKILEFRIQILKDKYDKLIKQRDKLEQNSNGKFEQRESIYNLPFEISTGEIKHKKLVVKGFFKKTEIKNDYQTVEVEYLKKEGGHYDLKFNSLEATIKILYSGNKIAFIYKGKEFIYPIELENGIIMKDRFNVTKIHQIKRPLNVDLGDVKFFLKFND